LEDGRGSNSRAVEDQGLLADVEGFRKLNSLGRLGQSLGKGQKKDKRQHPRFLHLLLGDFTILVQLAMPSGPGTNISVAEVLAGNLSKDVVRKLPVVGLLALH